MTEYDIGAKSPVHRNWEENKPLNEELATIFNPLATQFSNEISDRFSGESYEALQDSINSAANTYTLPYGRTTKLPPALFGHISAESIELKHSLVIPNTERKARKLTRGYSKWISGIAGNDRYTVSPKPDFLVEAMVGEEGIGGQECSQASWTMGALATQQALKQEDWYTFDSHYTNRINNAALDHDQLSSYAQAIYKQHGRYSLAISKIAGGDNTWQGTRDFVQLPIGEYGSEATEKLARLTVMLNDHAKTSTAIDSELRHQLTPTREAILSEHTARSRERSNNGIPDFAVHGPKNTLTEGVLSVAQAISFFTAEKVDGYDNHDDLVSALLDTTIIERFTKSIRPGYIGPATLSGLYMPGVLVPTDKGLSMSKASIEVLTSMRKEFVAETAGGWAMFRATQEESFRPQVLGLICPAASPHGGITAIKNILKPFYAEAR